MAMTLRPRVDGPPAPAPAPSSFPLAQAFEERRADIEPLLPQGVSLSRVIAELYLAWRRTPAIANVPVDKLIVAVGRALATGGVIDQDVYVVPFGKDATVMVDYKFKAEMVIAAGGARSIEVRAVYENEPFEVHYGSDARIVHQPLDSGARGKHLKGAYAIARIRSDITKFEWVDIADVDAIRAKSQQWGPSKLRECPAWYAKKTAVHQLVKLLPKSPRLRQITQLIEDEERVEFDEPTPRLAVAAGEDDVRMEPTGITGMEEAPSDDAAELTEALATVVQKRALGDVRNSGLVAIRKWAAEKLAADPGGESAACVAWVDRACQLILNARADGTLQEPPKKAQAEPALALGEKQHPTNTKTLSDLEYSA